jgi:hypothetical protein
MLAMVSVVFPVAAQPHSEAQAPSAAQPPTDGPPRPSSIVTFSGTLIEQAKSDFDSGGSYSVSSLLFRTSITKPVSRTTLVGFGFSYDLADYNFSNPIAFGGLAPWNKIHSITLSVPIISRYGKRWSIFASPSVSVSREFDADWGDSLAYGAIVAGTYGFGPKRKFGLGLGVFDRMDETRAFPFISVDWYFTDRLRLSNPLRAGPTGPAGLELAYTINSKWDFGAGAAYRSFRFRLDDQGIAPNGVGEQRGALAFARFTRSFGPKFSLVIYAGAVLNGELRLENVNNDRLASAPHGTAPLVAISFNGRL